MSIIKTYVVDLKYIFYCLLVVVLLFGFVTPRGKENNKALAL